MSIEQVQEFYKHTFENEVVQKQLIATQGIEEFVASSVLLAAKCGYAFSKDDMLSTLDGLGDDDECEDYDDIEEEWIRKIMTIGWVPLGYTR